MNKQLKKTLKDFEKIYTKKQIMQVLTKWTENHSSVFHYHDCSWWYVQNFLGDLIGWDEDYVKLIKKLEKRYDKGKNKYENK